jgi:hypothetical protein
VHLRDCRTFIPINELLGPPGWFVALGRVFTIYGLLYVTQARPAGGPGGDSPY